MNAPINGRCSWPDDCPTPDDCAKGCIVPAAPPVVSPAASGVIHIAGVHVTIGPLLRQRCLWCGELLIDYDLEYIAVPEGQDPTPATWPHGELVRVDGHVSTLVDHKDHDPLPEGSCPLADLAARPRVGIVETLDPPVPL